MAELVVSLALLAFSPSGALRPPLPPSARPPLSASATRPWAPSPACRPPSSPRTAAICLDEALISRSDRLHAENQPLALFEALRGADTADVELAWRVCRAHHDLAEEAVAEPRRREALLREGLAIAEAALEAHPESGPLLKWYGILLGRLSDFLPTKEKVANSFKIKEALDTAATKLPQDASLQTALGQWCLKVAGISWIERQAAKVLFGSPPVSTYEEALSYFERSHAIRPSKKASLQAGLAQQKLGRPAEAEKWLQRCLELEGSGEADAEIDRQAKEALGK
ncbi:hypothetical protein AB1Y20_003548 [Prymnesium parvum]|uniref:Regulator of microtubule dynamics protein 1 n=1 Tax=Prymnesium parvum TaxID=97485 RepID=A0AB34J799_PRYPA